MCALRVQAQRPARSARPDRTPPSQVTHKHARAFSLAESHFSSYHTLCIAISLILCVKFFFPNPPSEVVSVSADAAYIVDFSPLLSLSFSSLFVFSSLSLVLSLWRRETFHSIRWSRFLSPSLAFFLLSLRLFLSFSRPLALAKRDYSFDPMV